MFAPDYGPGMTKVGNGMRPVGRGKIIAGVGVGVLMGNIGNGVKIGIIVTIINGLTLTVTVAVVSPEALCVSRVKVVV